MKRFLSASTIVLGLSLIASSLMGCASHTANTRTNYVAEAAFIAASVAMCTLLDSEPNHPGSLEMAEVASAPPEALLVDNTRYDAESHDAIPEPSHVTSSAPTFGPSPNE